MLRDYPFPVDGKEFAGKRTLITGGTKGLGAAMAQRFAASGAKVAVTARSRAAGESDSTLFVQADLGTAAGCQTVIDRIHAAWGGLDILIDNVGASDTSSGSFDSLSDEVWQSILEINLLSAVRLDRAFVPGMRERRSGVVIHIGTIWHRLPQADAALAYCSAKAALSSYSKGLAKAVGPHGVRVNMVSPGFIETEAAHSWIMQIARSEGIGEEEARQQIIARSGGIPLGRTGRPAEIAELVAFLASDRAAFASGADYFLDGGAFPAR
jgi:NAD(P)-dependent dehydrogenase (short-subunit alcohol dehydrogenase family)